MKEEIKQEWISALRSGEYTQGIGYLKTVENSTPKHCCLGVLCDLFLKKNPESGWSWREPDVNHVSLFGADAKILPITIREWAGLGSSNPNIQMDELGKTTIAHINDRGLSFEKIAKIIDDQL